MKVTYSYRGEHKQVCCDFNQPKLSVNGEVTFTQRGWTDGNGKIHTVSISADELLKTAETCLKQLGEISGVKYKITVQVGNWTEFLEQNK